MDEEIPNKSENIEKLPNPWQRKVIWNALTYVALFTTGALAVYILKLALSVISYLQPILIPIAIAGVLAFLLEPVVKYLCRFKIKRLIAVIFVFAVVLAITASILGTVIPKVVGQGAKLAHKLPGYTVIARDQIVRFIDHQKGKINVRIPFVDSEHSEDKTEGEHNRESDSEESITSSQNLSNNEISDQQEEHEIWKGLNSKDPLAFLTNQLTEYLQEQTPSLLENGWKFIQRSVGGFLGIFGFLFSLILVPIYLFFFLLEGPKISATWSEYLPLRASSFKNEVVETLTEINGYLINFFRGQLLVSMIDGVLTAISLLILGLDYALLIGLVLAVLGLIPYIGIMLCWIPAVLIAVAQWPGDWFYPIMVTVIFVGVSQLEGLFIAPKIVGDSVGLHPMTAIVSLFAWSFMLGGLLGAILAVPLTATLKVLLKRYVWEKHHISSPNIIKPEKTNNDTNDPPDPVSNATT